MKNQKQFVANSQPVSDNELCNHNEEKNCDNFSAPVKGIQEQLSPYNTKSSSSNNASGAFTDTTDIIKDNQAILEIDTTSNKDRIEDVANTISGTQIMENVDTSDMADILSQINSANAEAIAEQELKYKEAEATMELQYEQLVAERKAELLKERIAHEEEHRKAEEERERQLEEEERLREQEQANSIKGKMSAVISTFSKNDMEGIKDVEAPAEKREGIFRRKGDSTKSSEKSKNDKKTQDTTDWEYVAKHDTLTGLLNASAYSTDITTAPLNSCIIFIDANNLKYLNDTFGHEAGDKLLSMIAKMLLRYFEGAAYRIGGDEFIVITNRPEDKVKKIIRNIKASLERQTKGDKTGMIYSIAVGYAYGDGKTPLTDIRAKADEMMYSDKEAYKESHPTLDKRKPPVDDKELMGLAYTDTLTGLKNKHAFERAEDAAVLTLIQIVGFDDLTRANGDRFAELVGKCMKNDAKKTEHCYYLGNGDFCVLSEQTPDVFISTITAKLHSLAIDITSQIMSGGGTNEQQLLLAKEVIATPKEKPKSYNERLSMAQRQMKETVRMNHEPVIEEDVASLMDIIQQKGSEIIMMFMASADFNNLFIFLDAEEFLQVAWDMGTSMDYSYIYAVYPGGALYYGADDYYSEITDLFQRIAENITGRDIRAKEISHIEGINIFENIYIK